MLWSRRNLCDSILALVIMAVSSRVLHAQAPLIPAPALYQQDALPPALMAYDDYNQRAVPAPIEYDEVIKRLHAAENRILQLERADEHAPQKTELYNTNTASDLATPSIEARLAAIEQKQAQPKPPAYPLIKLSGFLHVDAGYYNQDDVNRATLGDIQDGVGFRRARLGANGSVTELTNYLIEMDFAIAGRPSFTDVWGEQTQVPFFGNVRIGQFRLPTTMDGLTSIRGLDFLERSLPFQAFDPFRKVGVMAYDKSDDEMWSWGYAGFKSGGFNNAPVGDTRFATDIGDQGGYGVATRASHLLAYDSDECLVHIGGSYAYSRLTASANNPVPYYQSQPFPEFFLGDIAGGGLTANGTPPFVNTGRIPSRECNFLNGQLAGQNGSFHWQSEYMGTFVNQIAGPTVYYDGAYIQGGYFLTGEHFTYNKMFGAFEKVVPHEDLSGTGRCGQWYGGGAWEVTARWSYLNLNDPDANAIVVAAIPPSPDPGRMHESTLGLNWYWSAYAKMQFNWMHCFLDNAFTGDSDCDIFAARFHVGF